MIAEALLAVLVGACIAWHVFAFAFLFGSCVHQVSDAVPAGDESLCERLAAARGAECATVRQFAMRTADFHRNLEFCVPDRLVDAAELEHGPSWPSDDERFKPYAYAGIDPPCFHACPGVVGSNAFDGPYCPVNGVPPHWYPPTWQAPAVLCVDGTKLTFASGGWECL
jgi:hypothetical protein